MNLPGARTWIGLALTTTVAWFALESIRPDTDWARVEAPVFAIPGTPYPVQIEFTRPSSDREFGVDLHAPSADRGASKVVGVARGVLEPGRTRYAVSVPLRSGIDAKLVRLVIYTGPNGLWRDRTHAAISDAIPVRGQSAPDPAEPVARVHHRLADQEAPSIVPRVRSTVVRYITAAAWGVAGGILLVRRGPSDAGRSRATESLAGRACLAAAVVEVSDLGRFFGEAVRAVARAVSAYDGRETGQQWATALLLASALGLGGKWLASDRAPGHRLLMTSIVTGLGLLALDALSLHAIDRLAQYPCLGLPAVQVGGLVCSFVAAATGALVRHGPLPRPR